MEGPGELCGTSQHEGHLKGGVLVPFHGELQGRERHEERTLRRATWKECKALTGSQGVRDGKLTWKDRITVLWKPI